MIPYGRQEITEADITAVTEVLRSEYLTQGPVVPAFEAAVASYCGADYSVAVNSATSALHLACLALGVGSGDRVWTSPITFVASANCAIYCGASVDFVDIDPLTYNMSMKCLEEKLRNSKATNTLPKVLIPVHFSGQSCEMKRIRELADQYQFKIIEDASHAIGATYGGDAVGSCRLSDITVFSFHPVKIITTGEGGMALTNDRALARRMQLLRSHGITRDSSEMTKEPDGSWYYQQIELGFNYRMTDIQAALGMSQLSRLDEYVRLRREIALRYDSLLSDLPVTLPYQHPNGFSSSHLYVIRLQQLRERGLTRNDLVGLMKQNGIGVNVHYIPLHQQPYFSRMNPSICRFPEAERYYSEALSLPIFPTLTAEAQIHIVDTLRHLINL